METATSGSFIRASGVSTGLTAPGKNCACGNGRNMPEGLFKKFRNIPLHYSKTRRGFQRANALLRIKTARTSISFRFFDPFAANILAKYPQSLRAARAFRSQRWSMPRGRIREPDCIAPVLHMISPHMPSCETAPFRIEPCEHRNMVLHFSHLSSLRTSLPAKAMQPFLGFNAPLAVLRFPLSPRRCI